MKSSKNIQTTTTAAIETTSSENVYEQIKELKKNLDEQLANGLSLPFQIDVVITHLRNAEKMAAEDPSIAWFEIVRAKIALHEGSSISLLELAQADPRVLRQELYKVWHELNEVQRQYRHVNTTNTADWLTWGEKSLEGNASEKSHVMYCIMRARYSLAKAQEFADWDKYGYLAIVLESLYLIGLPLAILSYARFVNAPATSIMASTMLQVPFYVFVWGFLGGVSWSIYSAAYWSKHRLFDRHYFSWYLVHPWVSAVLGGAVTLIAMGGLTSLGAFNPNSQPGTSLLALISFVSGFSTNTLWKLLDTSVRKFFNIKKSSRNVHEKAHDESLVESDN